jgi:hypothetical protein
MAIATAAPLPPSPAEVEFALLQSWLSSSATLQLPLHAIEAQQPDKGREVLRLLLQAHLEQRGHGDVGPALRGRSGLQQLLYAHRRLGARSLTTVFGAVEVTHGLLPSGGAQFLSPGPGLSLPGRSFSYELQRRLVKAAVQNPFLASVETIAELVGVSVSKRSLEQILPDVAQDFDAFYQQRPPEVTTGSILVASVDGKGIPVVKPVSPQPALRLTKGQKTNKKRMATVATVFTRVPWVRTPQQVLERLFPTQRQTRGDKAAAPRPENKRVWASLVKGKSAVIDEVAAEMDRRDPAGSLTRIALTNGERALQIRVKAKLRVVLILDLMHVMEELWKAAYVFHAEGSLEADLWVLERTLGFLSGDAGPVVKGLRQSVTKRRLSGAPQKTLQAVAAYLSKNRSYMRYHQYLSKGWPIASGPVEGACKNLIKDRMKRSGMCWTPAMAEAVVKLFHIQQDQQRLYPAHWTHKGAESAGCVPEGLLGVRQKAGI